MPDLNVTFTFTLPSADLATIVAAYLKVVPNVEKDANGDPVYTDNQWVKEHVRRRLENQLNRIIIQGQNQIAEEAGSHTTLITVT